jgi:hypothetical protein
LQADNRLRPLVKQAIHHLASTGKVEAKYTASDSFVKVQFLWAIHLFYVENRLRVNYWPVF